MQIAEAAKLSRTVLDALQQVIVGKEQVLQHLLLGLYSGGNILIEDFPGLAKTLTARLLAQVTGLDFKRIQFTPDLLPGDITGGFIYNQKRGEFEFRPGWRYLAHGRTVDANLERGDSEWQRPGPRRQHHDPGEWPSRSLERGQDLESGLF